MFYTYFHTRNDTQKPFYVGKGSGRRARDIGRNSYWQNIVAKYGHTVHIAAHWPTEAEAFEHEKFLILCFKDMGLKLANMTDGGEGTAGWVPSEENRQVTSKVSRERWADSAFKLRTVKAIKQGFAAPGVREKRNESISAALARPDVKQKLSAAQKRLWQDPAHREKMQASRKASEAVNSSHLMRIAKSSAKLQTPEAKERTSRISLARWADPIFREMMAKKRAKP